MLALALVSAAALALAKCFYVIGKALALAKCFYVMGKALSGELSCPCDRSYSILWPLSRLFNFFDMGFYGVFRNISVRLG